MLKEVENAGVGELLAGEVTTDEDLVTCQQKEKTPVV